MKFKKKFKKFLKIFYFMPFILAVAYDKPLYLLVYGILLTISLVKIMSEEEKRNRLRKIRGIKVIWLEEQGGNYEEY